MNKFLAFLAVNIGKVILSKHDQRVLLWKINKLENLRYNYDLNEDSVVFDLGGYKGEWTEKIFSKYRCYIYVF